MRSVKKSNSPPYRPYSKLSHNHTSSAPHQTSYYRSSRSYYDQVLNYMYDSSFPIKDQDEMFSTTKSVKRKKQGDLFDSVRINKHKSPQSSQAHVQNTTSTSISKSGSSGSTSSLFVNNHNNNNSVYVSDYDYINSSSHHDKKILVTNHEIGLKYPLARKYASSKHGSGGASSSSNRYVHTDSSSVASNIQRRSNTNNTNKHNGGRQPYLGEDEDYKKTMDTYAVGGKGSGSKGFRKLNVALSPPSKHKSQNERNTLNASHKHPSNHQHGGIVGRGIVKNEGFEGLAPTIGQSDGSGSGGSGDAEEFYYSEPQKSTPIYGNGGGRYKGGYNNRGNEVFASHMKNECGKSEKKASINNSNMFSKAKKLTNNQVSTVREEGSNNHRTPVFRGDRFSSKKIAKCAISSAEDEDTESCKSSSSSGRGGGGASGHGDIKGVIQSSFLSYSIDEIWSIGQANMEYCVDTKPQFILDLDALEDNGNDSVIRNVLLDTPKDVLSLSHSESFQFTKSKPTSFPVNNPNNPNVSPSKVKSNSILGSSLNPAGPAPPARGAICDRFVKRLHQNRLNSFSYNNNSFGSSEPEWLSEPVELDEAFEFNNDVVNGPKSNNHALAPHMSSKDEVKIEEQLIDLTTAEPEKCVDVCPELPSESINNENNFCNHGNKNFINEKEGEKAMPRAKKSNSDLELEEILNMELIPGLSHIFSNNGDDNEFGPQDIVKPCLETGKGDDGVIEMRRNNVEHGGEVLSGRKSSGGNGLSGSKFQQFFKKHGTREKEDTHTSYSLFSSSNGAGPPGFHNPLKKVEPPHETIVEDMDCGGLSSPFNSSDIGDSFKHLLTKDGLIHQQQQDYSKFRPSKNSSNFDDFFENFVKHNSEVDDSIITATTTFHEKESSQESGKNPGSDILSALLAGPQKSSMVNKIGEAEQNRCPSNVQMISAHELEAKMLDNKEKVKEAALDLPTSVGYSLTGNVSTPTNKHINGDVEERGNNNNEMAAFNQLINMMGLKDSNTKKISMTDLPNKNNSLNGFVVSPHSHPSPRLSLPDTTAPPPNSSSSSIKGAKSSNGEVKNVLDMVSKIPPPDLKKPPPHLLQPLCGINNPTMVSADHDLADGPIKSSESLMDLFFSKKKCVSKGNVGISFYSTPPAIITSGNSYMKNDMSVPPPSIVNGQNKKSSDFMEIHNHQNSSQYHYQNNNPGVSMRSTFNGFDDSPIQSSSLKSKSSTPLPYTSGNTPSSSSSLFTPMSVLKKAMIKTGLSHENAVRPATPASVCSDVVVQNGQSSFARAFPVNGGESGSIGDLSAFLPLMKSASADRSRRVQDRDVEVTRPIFSKHVDSDFSSSNFTDLDLLMSEMEGRMERHKREHLDNEKTGGEDHEVKNLKTHPLSMFSKNNEKCENNSNENTSEPQNDLISQFFG